MIRGPWRNVLVVTVAVGAAACASSPSVQSSAGGEVAAVTPANASTLPAGSQLDVTLDQQLGTESSHTGDAFSATVANAIVAQNGSTTVPAGAKVWGHVSGVRAASNATEQAAIALAFDSLTFNGARYPFEANVTATDLQRRGGTSTNETLKNAAIGAAAGAVLGAILSGADKDKILIGAGVGAVAGTAISLGRGGTNGVLPAGSRMTIQVAQSVALR